MLPCARCLQFRVPLANLEPSHNKKRVNDDRAFAIDATVVRIMKSRKLLRNQELVTEVLSQLQFFKPDVRMIKKRIESLLEREYLERDVADSTTFKYLA